MGLRLHLPDFDADFQGEISMLVPQASGQLDDLLPLTESLIKQGHSHLRPWIAVARQVEAAAAANEDQIRDFMAETFEKARSLGWTPDQDLFGWFRERGGFVEASEQAPAEAKPDGGWA